MTRLIVTVVLGAALLVAGLFVGRALTDSGPTSDFPTRLEEVRTSDGNFVGRVVADDDDYIRLADPATVAIQSADDGSGAQQLVVQRLASEPFGLVGDILISREQVIFVGAVANDSQLAAAYAEASHPDSSPAEPAP